MDNREMLDTLFPAHLLFQDDDKKRLERKRDTRDSMEKVKDAQESALILALLGRRW